MQAKAISSNRPRESVVLPRKTWPEICAHDEYCGRWVALDDCEYDQVTGETTLGTIVDVDDDLADLCSRIRESERKNCAIVFIQNEEDDA